MSMIMPTAVLVFVLLSFLLFYKMSGRVKATFIRKFLKIFFGFILVILTLFTIVLLPGVIGLFFTHKARVILAPLDLMIGLVEYSLTLIFDFLEKIYNFIF